ncbi:MAG TPA: uL15m family ribosomal protein, partial [Tenuifilaceae bacterium]|nr:uL15m family ribosomal protein [Tenuifilaceae bacterium]
ADKHGIASIDAQTLIDAGYISKNDLVKILGNGTLTSKLEVKAHAFSKKAIEAIEAVQGTAVKL